MKDPVERHDVLDALNAFRNGVFHDDNLRRDNQHDWEAAYSMGKLHDRLYKLPRAKEEIGYQKIKKCEGWGETLHICSKCGKIVPFIDWCQPYCSGCGVRFRNYAKWQSKESIHVGKNSCMVNSNMQQKRLDERKEKGGSL